MPHKHVRKDTNGSHFNLAPFEKAKPLPAFAAKSAKAAKVGVKKPDTTAKSQKRKRSKKDTKDDTPKAFARLMAFHTTGKRPDGLDDEAGERRARKKQKTTPTTTPKPEPEPEPTSATDKTSLPKIQPGEKLADYSARVDQALPIGHLVSKTKKVDGLKARQTKKERKMHRLYASWRQEEARLKAREEELAEQREEEEEERRVKYGEKWDAGFDDRKRKRAVGEMDDGEEDPWAVLKAKRAAKEREEVEAEAARAKSAGNEQAGRRRAGGLRGVHDVVEAPPVLRVVPGEKFKVVPRGEFKVKGGAMVKVVDVPNKAGSLKRREELGEARRDVIARYRAMMRGEGGL